DLHRAPTAQHHDGHGVVRDAQGIAGPQRLERPGPTPVTAASELDAAVAGPDLGDHADGLGGLRRRDSGGEDEDQHGDDTGHHEPPGSPVSSNSKSSTGSALPFTFTAPRSRTRTRPLTAPSLAPHALRPVPTA